jgi:hypothetical protein
MNQPRNGRDQRSRIRDPARVSWSSEGMSANLAADGSVRHAPGWLQIIQVCG